MRPRILVVDDEPDMLAFLERGLRGAYLVIRASDAAGALAILAHDEAVEGLITDQHMPGMSGLELVARVLAARPQVATVLLSGLDETATAEVPVDARVRKPVDSLQLRKAVASALERARARRR